VGTNAALKAVHHDALDRAGIDLMFANTYHLMLQPGTGVVEAMGGAHAMMGRERPLITDSGGFQVFSLGLDAAAANATANGAQAATPVKELKSRGVTKHKTENLLLRVDEDGALFKSYRDGTTQLLTPESSVLAQKAIGGDIIIPLDELPPFDIDDDILRESVYRSHRWMARSLQTHLSDVRQQAMYGVIHGGTSRELRKLSVDYLSSLPFDGLAIGGSLGRDSAELHELMQFLMPLLPRELPNHLLGIADVGNVERAVALGVDTFDSCYPTQVARHGTLFTHTRGRINFRRAEFKASREPACAECACTLCAKHSLGYLHHLDRAKEPLAWSLASEHNLFHMGSLMERVREKILRDEI
jgi:queuine tRNA-ribosyltransferase